MKLEELADRLHTAPVLDAVPDSKAQEALETLLKSDGIVVLYGLMLGAKQAQLLALSKSPLTNMETISRAAVIQGKIIGIDLWVETLLEQAVPSPDDKEQ